MIKGIKNLFMCGLKKKKKKKKKKLVTAVVCIFFRTHTQPW